MCIFRIRVFMQLPQASLLSFLGWTLRPVARFCLRHGIKLQDVVECLKTVLLDVAREQLPEGKATDSRLSIMTGVHRKDVVRLGNPDLEAPRSLDLVSRVLGQWQGDPEYCTKGKQPRALSFGSDGSDFSNLVRKVSKELNPATVLFELERVGAVDSSGNKLKLAIDIYTPEGDLESGFKIFSEDSGDLLSAVEENLLRKNETPNLHVRTEYDKVRADAIPEIRRFLLREGHLLHEKARSFLASHDQDINPQEGFRGEVCKVGLGSFSLIRKK